LTSALPMLLRRSPSTSAFTAMATKRRHRVVQVQQRDRLPSNAINNKHARPRKKHAGPQQHGTCVLGVNGSHPSSHTHHSTPWPIGTKSLHLGIGQNRHPTGPLNSQRTVDCCDACSMCWCNAVVVRKSRKVKDET
jgi:hypothetical protein